MASVLAPAAFAVLFTVALVAIALEIAVAVANRRGASPGLSRLRRVARIVAPVALVAAGMVLAGLSLRERGPEASPSDHDSAPLTSAAPVIVAADGIGAARAGMSRADVRAALPPGHQMGQAPAPFMVDVAGVPVTAGTDTLYVLLYPAGSADDDGAPVPMVATTWSRARTEQDVGPGTSLAEARVRYGVPTLSYNTVDESREYARFPEQPGERLLFRVSGAGGRLAGAYASGGEYRETTTYDPGARITMVLVRLQP